MCTRGAIHVFIGAPSVPCGIEGSVSEGHTAVWEDIPFTHKMQDASLQSGGSHLISSHQVLNGGQNGKTEHGKHACDGHPVLAEQFGRTCDQECDFGQKVVTDDIAIVSDLVSSTELCHITHAVQKPVGKEGEFQDPDVIESDVCRTISAETEFLAVLTSSQLAVKCPDNNGTKGANHTELRRSELMAPDILVEDLTTGSESQESFTCSSDLFTTTSDELLNKKSLESQTNEEGLLLIKDESAALLGNNADYLGSASSKRKKDFTASSAPSHHKLQSKKSKQSTSPVKYTMERYERGQTTPGKPLALLNHCSEKNKDYSIMVVVLQPCHVKEIKVKSGPSIGSTLPLATIVVMDQSEVKQKVLMWRTAAFWSLALLPGEVIVLTDVSVCEDRWTGEIFLQSSFRSKLINFGSCSSLLSGESSHPVERPAVKELLDYLQKKHSYLSELSPRQPQRLEHIQHVSLADLQPELLVHAVLKVNNISILKESTYHFKGLLQNKIILTVEQVKGQASTLVLWGTCVTWSDQIHLKKDHIWIFKYLLCKKNIISGDLELHTTPWSSSECLFDDDQRALDFRKRYNISSAKHMSLLTMIDDRYSGEIQVRGSIMQIEFNISDKHKILIKHETSVSDILKSLPDIIYTGCGKCRRELRIDDNNVYEQCYVCLPFNHVRSFYRSAHMTVVGDDCCVRVQVPPDILEIVFLNISPNLLDKVFSSCTDVTYGMVVADLCCSLLAQTGESFVFTIRSQFMLDENSIPLEADFHLSDFHLDCI
ncbi:shieldin complex subunit 2 [Bufo bufo]|uniref:shieldin complex subunit 2 n=1 Tax=Bufo bufo TaxID=8384 RepID=UPI001ABDFB9D|nr:shieldin complex subunit 2 [Bufo bufo]